MLYRIVKPFATLALRIHFRKIYITNRDYIPSNKPVILAVNHPTMFIEPCMLACFLPISLHFLARGNLFKKNIHAMMLRSLHLIPIFRMKDGGYEKIKNNFNTLDYCYQALKDGKTILIMAEGHCVQEKRLQPMKKGPARLAFGTYKLFGDLDIQIVPVGVSYTYPDEFRSEAMVEFGEPIEVREYLKLYDKNPPEATRAITEEIGKRLEKLIVVIDKKEDEELVEQLLVMNRTQNLESIFPVFSEDDSRLIMERNVANQVNKMPEDKKQQLKEKGNKYFQHLTNYNTSDEAVAYPDYYRFDRSMVLVIGFIPFILGYLFNFIPMYLAELLGTKVRDHEDRMSIVIAAAIVFYILYFLVLFITGAIVKSISLWIFIGFIPIWGYFALLYREYYRKWNAARQLTKMDSTIVTQLKATRAQIIGQI